jgi:hypothetical protein
MSLQLKLLRTTLALFFAAIALAACDFPAIPPGVVTPTLESLVTPSGTPDATETATLTPSPIVIAQPQLESPTPTFTPGPPTETATPTETPGPFQHTIAEGETLIRIIQQYGYDDLGVIDQIVLLNNLPNADRLPGAGSIILIPRQTATPTPVGMEMTVAAGGVVEVAALPENAIIVQHQVREGETILAVTGQYNTTLSVINQLNPELIFINCDFENPSGGPDCNVPLQIGQLVNVPGLTPTPTLSPTPSGSETPTPTPTYNAPLLVFPPQGAIAPPRPVSLQWVSIGLLKPEEYYLVEVEDTTAGATYLNVTKDTSYTLDNEVIPTDGQPHAMRWRIRIGVANEQGAFRPVSGETAWRDFQWQSR